jgi:site-specific recombinase XerD
MPKRKVGASGNVYRRKDREGITIVWRDIHGRRRSRMLKTATVTEARQILAAEKAKVDKAKILGEPLPSEVTFEGWADEFLKFQGARITPHVMRGKLSRAEFKRQQGIIESKLKPFFGTMKLAMIRRGDVVRFIHKREAEVTSGTVIKEVNVLKRLLNVAVDREMISANPAQRAPMPKAPEGRTRFLTPEEWQRVFAACRIPPDIYGKEQEQWLQQAAGLAISLGARRGEMLSITVPDVDLERRQVALKKTKNGKPRTLYINDLALQVFESMGLRERKRRQDRRVLFPSITPEQLSMRFLRAARQAGVEELSLHSLRHSFASTLRMAGADLHDLMVLGGWSDLRMVTRYAHLTSEHLQRAAARMDGVLTLPPTPEKPHE